MTENMKLWDAVCTTDPSATKKVNQRGGFTAIDAYSQIRAATGQFGPAGQGWGWDIKEFQYLPNDTMVVHVRLWVRGAGENRGFGVCGQAGLYTKGDNPKPDADCAKKAVTDAITKGLSYLGFNADVFLGKFDDNKYVESLKAKPSTDEPAGVTKIKERWRKMHAALKSVKNEEDLDKLVKKGATLMNDLQKNIPEWHKTALGDIKAKRDSFTAKVEADEAVANLGAG